MNQSQRMIESLEAMSEVKVTFDKRNKDLFHIKTDAPNRPASGTIRKTPDGQWEVEHRDPALKAGKLGNPIFKRFKDIAAAKKYATGVLTKTPTIPESLAEASQVQVGDEVKVNMGKAKKLLPGDFASPHVLNILRKTIKAGGGTVTVHKIVGTDAMVAGEVAAILGTVMVPIAALTVVRAK